MSPLEILLSALLGIVLLGALLLLLRRSAGHRGRSDADRFREEMHGALIAQQKAFSDQLSQVGELLKNQLDSLTKQVGVQLKTTLEVSERSSGKIDARLDTAARVIGEVKEALGKLGEANQRIYEVGRDIASLQEILRSPKLRGGLGELFLGDLLAEILPRERYTLQHTFQSGETVDAVIRLAERIVPVDAKFPLASFARLKQVDDGDARLKVKRELIRDVRKHIDAIAAKYIRPGEGTLDFALMYIPAENVYYEVITRDEGLPEDYDLFSYAVSHRVVPVSPNSFYAYLQTILLGLNGLRLAENITSVLGRLGELETAFGRVDADFQVVGKHLRNSLNRFQEAQGHLQAFHAQLAALTHVNLESPSSSFPGDVASGMVVD
jgi:DNA recombination protein RmuC